MPSLPDAVDQILAAQRESGKALAIILAGHNGSGKSTMWRESLAGAIQIPLINADRMMMSILPEANSGRLPEWATRIRDSDLGWMQVAQKGVESFVAQAMAHRVPFAMETVFSHWRNLGGGKIRIKGRLNSTNAKCRIFRLAVLRRSIELSVINSSRCDESDTRWPCG